MSNTIIFRVEEIPALACPNLPGIWVTVAGLGEGGKEAPILVGILSCDQDLEDSTFEETLSEVVVKAMMATRAMADSFMMVEEEVEMVKMN